VIYVLGEIGDARAVIPLTAVLEHDSDDQMRTSAAKALSKLQRQGSNSSLTRNSIKRKAKK
jgi:HEAT repeat protein